MLEAISRYLRPGSEYPRSWRRSRDVGCKKPRNARTFRARMVKTSNGNNLREGESRIVSAGTRAACATAFLTTSHVLGSRAWTPTWKYDPRRTGWRIDMRAFDAFIDPRWARKSHQGRDPLDRTLHLPDARLYRSAIYRSTVCFDSS